MIHFKILTYNDQVMNGVGISQFISVTTLDHLACHFYYALLQKTKQKKNRNTEQDREIYIPLTNYK